MAHTPSDPLVLEIMRSLEIDWQWIQSFAASDTDAIAKARSAGRKAGRALGRKVITRQSEPRDNDRVTVIVAASEAPDDPADRERMRERTRLIMENAFRDFGDLDSRDGD